MPLSAGTRLGPYEIVSMLGSGGMGEVYKALDTRLNRAVAIKVSSERVNERFEREARAVAALNHPNIVALYDIGENFIVTELVEGESLRTAQLTPRKVIEVAAQVAEGLAAAHAVGIAHRDIKPENVMLTRDGRAKILDFGLARQYAGVGSDAETRTEPGTVLGTVAYMSPEQVRGEEADHRSDIFSFGLLLYEMLAGQRAFAGATAPEIMTAILREDPPELSPSVSIARREIVRHCLEKDPAARFQSAKDLSFALRSLLTESGSTASQQAIVDASPASRPWVLYGAIAATVIAAFAGGWFANSQPAFDLSNHRYTPIASEEGAENNPAWSPDGKSIAYNAAVDHTSQIFIRRLDSPVPDQITHEAGASRRPFWSRIGEQIYFIKGTQLWSIAAIGGAPQKVQDNVQAADISPDGSSLGIVTRKNELVFGKLGSKEAAPYHKPPFNGTLTARILRFSPDGSKLAVIATRINAGAGEIWMIPLPAEKGSPMRVFESKDQSIADNNISWMPDSRNLVISRSYGTEAAHLYLGDSQTGKLRRLTTGLDNHTSPAVSPNGKRIVFAQQAADTDLVEIMLDGGGMRPLLSTARTELAGSWLKNGREYVYLSDANGPLQVWVRNPEEVRPRLLLPSAADLSLRGNRYAAVTVAPDGERLAVEGGGVEHSIWVFRRSGGNTVRLDPESSDVHGVAWSPDGNWIAYGRVRPKQQLMKVPSGGGTPIPIANQESGAGPTSMAWSPTGEWIAWSADTIRLFSPDGKQQKKLSDDGLRRQVGFSADGRTLYSYYEDRKEHAYVLDAHDVASGRQRRVGKILSDDSAELRGFGLHPDGKRFLASLIRNRPDLVMLEGF